MTILEAVVLGAVQGITEFLPISSSGHLILLPELLGWQAHGKSFDVILHLATLAAILVALRVDISRLFDGLLRRDKLQQSLGKMLVIATVPALLAGALFADWFDRFRNPVAIAVSLIVWGVLLALADRFSAIMRGHIGDPAKTRLWQAVAIGVTQIFALFPGTSRSGATITAGLFAGLTREAAARFSFLLAIPITVAAGSYELIGVAKDGLDVTLLPLAAGFVSAFVFGLLAIRLLIAIASQVSFAWFAIYRILLAIFVLWYVGT